MAQKDMATKILEAHPDVFADVFNGLGKNITTKLVADELEDVSARSFYKKVHGKIHTLERDVVKSWEKKNICIACIGFENQSAPDPDMPIRVLCYDAADYGEQIHPKKGKTKHKKGQGYKNHYPVVTLVLYFGYKRPWSGPQCLKDCLDFPEDWGYIVSDYNINVFQIAYLTPEQIALFKSDFKLIADFLVQKRKNGNYTGNHQKIVHRQDTLQLLTALTGDPRYEALYDEKHPERGPKDMCEIVDQFIAKGKAEGRAEGEARGETKIVLLMNKLYSLNRVADVKKALKDQKFRADLMKKFGIA